MNYNKDVKTRILDAAYDLFSTKGFEKTTINNIVNAAYCSKGGFYHHFSSKDEVLEKMMIGYIEGLNKQYKNLIEQDIDIFEILSSIVSEINEIKKMQFVNWPKLIKILTCKDNGIVIKKMADEFEEITVNVYKKIFERGNKEGIFRIKYPKHLSGLWTREVLRIYEEANKVVLNEEHNNLDEFKELLDFSEVLLNKSLDSSKGKVIIKAPMLDYINRAIKRYDEIRSRESK